MGDIIQLGEHVKSQRESDCETCVKQRTRKNRKTAEKPLTDKEIRALRTIFESCPIAERAMLDV